MAERTDPPPLPCSTLKLWDYSKGKVSGGRGSQRARVGSWAVAGGAQEAALHVAWCTLPEDSG